MNTSKVIADAEKQTKLMLERNSGCQKGETGTCITQNRRKRQFETGASKDWTSGFFPGTLWYLQEYTKKENGKMKRRLYTPISKKKKQMAVRMIWVSKCIAVLEMVTGLFHDAHYKEVIIESAKTLSTRFNKKAGVIRSWDHHQEQWRFPVIIDNMMNLELLFEATNFT
jgi:unsaturated chondroitin disaccharide hydrolase